MLNSANPALRLASTSRYRAELLARLRLPFTTGAPDLDESAQSGEGAAALTRRLARAKAQKLAAADTWVLGSDQAAECEGRLLGKPGSHARAVEQLRFAAGREVRFHTAVALLGADRCLEAADVTTVRFRALDDATIERYLAAEPAYDCAGSFKCEGLGITLFERIDSSDPTALVGLPLIATARLLREAGFVLP
jgi:septum formation protein